MNNSPLPSRTGGERPEPGQERGGRGGGLQQLASGQRGRHPDMMLHMLDHIGLNVSDYDASREFFSRGLAPLGYRMVMEPVPKVGGFAPPDHPSVPFWIAEGRGTVTVSHVAFTADDRATGCEAFVEHVGERARIP